MKKCHYISSIYVFQAIRHLKLNTKESPCEASDDYRFAMCLENRILSQVGCQPFWIERKLEPALPPCQNSTKFDEILERYDLLQQQALDELIANYKCPMPCAYVKYEVQCNVIKFTLIHF